MIDFSACKRNRFKTYGGANGSKIGIIYNDTNYMLKFPALKKEKTPTSYNNSCVSEYLGCHIYQSLGIPAQDTLLGTYNGKIVVACEDFNQDGFRLTEFSALKNTCIDSSESGYGTELSAILNAIQEQDLVSTEEMKTRFWDMFIADAFLGNFDRHNGNWGILINEEKEEAKLAPVYDCGSCLYPKPNEGQIERILSDPAEIQNRIYVFPTSAIKIQNKKINYFDFISSLQDTDCNAALRRIVPSIDMGKINQIIEKTPYISSLQKQFYKTMLAERKTRILDYSLKKMDDYKI